MGSHFVNWIYFWNTLGGTTSFECFCTPINMNKNITAAIMLRVVVFVYGAVVMILELTASRYRSYLEVNRSLDWFDRNYFR